MVLERIKRIGQRRTEALNSPSRQFQLYVESMSQLVIDGLLKPGDGLPPKIVRDAVEVWRTERETARYELIRRAERDGEVPVELMELGFPVGIRVEGPTRQVFAGRVLGITDVVFDDLNRIDYFKGAALIGERERPLVNVRVNRGGITSLAPEGDQPMLHATQRFIADLYK